MYSGSPSLTPTKKSADASPYMSTYKTSSRPYGSTPVIPCKLKVDAKFNLPTPALDLSSEEFKSPIAPRRTLSRHCSSGTEGTSEYHGGATYTGPFNEYGERHGQGELVWKNGDVFKGMFENGVRQGQGTLTYAGKNGEDDSGEYVGGWANDKMHGNGTRRYPNGGLYIGEYEYGRKEGEGRFYYANGDLYWGSWHRNKMNGPGRYYYSSGKRFEGNFVDSMRTGKGKLQKKDGSLEIFHYKKDRRMGDGVRWSPDRKKAWRLSPDEDEVLEESISPDEAVEIVTEIELTVAANEAQRR